MHCAGFVGSEVTCRPGTCQAGVALLPLHCIGNGSCPVGPDTIKKCEPFACGTDACKTSCAGAVAVARAIASPEARQRILDTTERMLVRALCLV